MLAHWVETHTEDSHDFRAFAPLIAEDMCIPCNSDEDHAAVFARVTELPSFVRKGVSPKMMRWFSVNQLWHERRSEFWALNREHCDAMSAR